MNDLGETGSLANILALPVPLPPNPCSPYQGVGSGSGTEALKRPEGERGN